MAVSILTDLCEILLIELQITDNPEIISELESYVVQLFEIAEKQHSFTTLTSAKLLQGKLALIQLKINLARKFFKEAQQIADEHGLQKIALSISQEHDKLLDQLDLWENLKETKIPISDRMKLASISGIMENMKGKQVKEVTKPETEYSVLLTIMSQTGYTAFSNPFTAEMTIDESRMGDLLSSFSRNIDQIFSDSLDRIKIGEYTVMINPIKLFSICYVFRGQSYSAGQKLNNFAEALKDNKGLMEILNTAVRTGQQIQLSDNPDLEELINESFLADPKKFQLPFKAYNGDQPFLFVSYAHSDKLQVYPIMDYLDKSGFNVWYDEGISVSEDWIKSIVGNIEKCSAFLVFITPHIIDSEYVRKEIRFALSRKKPFYSVYLKDTILPAELEFEISGIQSMKKYTMPNSEFYDKIKEVLSPVLSGKN